MIPESFNNKTAIIVWDKTIDNFRILESHELSSDNFTDGKHGGIIATGTSFYYPPTNYSFYAIKGVNGNCMVNVASGNVSGLNNISIPQGDFIIGRFTAVSLSSGSAYLGYKLN